MKFYSGFPEELFVSLGDGRYAYNGRVVSEKRRSKILNIYSGGIRPVFGSVIITTVSAAFFMWQGVAMGIALGLLYWGLSAIGEFFILFSCPRTDIVAPPVPFFGKMSRTQKRGFLFVIGFFVLEIGTALGLGLYFSTESSVFRWGFGLSMMAFAFCLFIFELMRGHLRETADLMEKFKPAGSARPRRE